jgi:hypothetical protein
MPDREHELLLARLDERVKQLERENGLFRVEMDRLAKLVTDYHDIADEQYLKKEMFQPVQRAVFAVIGLIVFGVITALLGLVLPKH